jgi:hypothetical protein
VYILLIVGGNSALDRRHQREGMGPFLQPETLFFERAHNPLGVRIEQSPHLLTDHPHASVFHHAPNASKGTFEGLELGTLRASPTGARGAQLRSTPSLGIGVGASTGLCLQLGV